MTNEKQAYLCLDCHQEQIKFKEGLSTCKGNLIIMESNTQPIETVVYVFVGGAGGAIKSNRNPALHTGGVSLKTQWWKLTCTDFT